MQQIPWSTAPAVVSRVNFCCWWIFTSWRHGFSLQDLRWYTPYVVLHSSHFDAHRKIAYFQRYSPPSLLINHGDCDGAKHRSTTQTSIDCWEYARYYIEGEREVSIEALGRNRSSCVSICRCVFVAPCLLHHSAFIAHSFFLSIQTFTVSLSFRLCVELVNWGKLRLRWLDRKRACSFSVRWCVRSSFVACLPLICTPPLLTRCLFALQVIELCLSWLFQTKYCSQDCSLASLRRYCPLATDVEAWMGCRCCCCCRCFCAPKFRVCLLRMAIVVCSSWW